MASFASLAVKERLGDNSKLSKLSQIIDWSRFSKYLSKLRKSEFSPSSGGRKPYNNLAMFKLILLGQWNSMSDPELEYAIRIRLDFISFCGFDVTRDIPDETTICRFRNKLIEKELLQKLLDEVNYQLVGLGLKVEKTNLAILDATIIESNSRPKNKVLEEEILKDRKEDESDSNKFKEIKSSDPDAAWLKKEVNLILVINHLPQPTKKALLIKQKQFQLMNQKSISLQRWLYQQMSLLVTKVMILKEIERSYEKEELKLELCIKSKKISQ